MTPEITDTLLQAAKSILVVVGAAMFVGGITTISLLVKWHFFPLSRPGAGEGDVDTILKSEIKNRTFKSTLK